MPTFVAKCRIAALKRRRRRHLTTNAPDAETIGHARCQAADLLQQTGLVCAMNVNIVAHALRCARDWERIRFRPVCIQD